jgi:hypothetical protein
MSASAPPYTLYVIPGSHACRSAMLMLDHKRVRGRPHPSVRYDRLNELKRNYDPDNLFRLHQNIPPG